MPRPGLATVLVGDDPASHVYIGNKIKACEEAGIRSIHHGLPEDVSQAQLEDLVSDLNSDDEVDGILVQMPLPEHLDQDPVVTAIDPAKDVDGLTATSAGLLAQGRPAMVPCTPLGIMELLSAAGVEVSGANAVVVGRSILVGRPMAALLTNASATVTVCHSRTRELGAVCAAADILVAAVGLARDGQGRLGEAGRSGHRRGHQPHRRRSRRRRRFQGGGGARGGDHTRSGRGRPDDDRDAPPQHGWRSRRTAPFRRGAGVGWRAATRPKSTTGRGMDANNLSTGEKIAGASGVVLLIVMFLVEWFTYGEGAFSVGGDAWQTMEFIRFVILLAALAGIALAVMAATQSTVNMPVAMSALTTGVGILAVVLIIFRIISPPDFGIGDIADATGQDFDVGRGIGVFLGLIAAAGVTYGGWMAMQEEGASFGGQADRFQDPGPGAGPGAPPPQQPPQQPPTAPPPSQGAPPSGPAA